MSEHSGGSSKPTFKELISVIDRAWEAKWAIQLLQLLLFLDLAMIFVGQPGILGWDSASTPVLGNLSFVFVTIVSFTIYAAFLTPLFSSIAVVVLALIPGVLPSRDSAYQPPGFVSISAYKTDAYEKDDKEMIARYHEFKERNRADISQQWQTGNILFGTLVLILFNALLGLIMTDTNSTILQTAIGKIGWKITLFIAFVLAIGMFSAITRSWFYSAERWIEHPKLYQELESKRRKEREKLGVPPYPR